jgi:hypothetical protein
VVVRSRRSGRSFRTVSRRAKCANHTWTHIPPNLVLAYDPAGIMKSYDFIRYMMASEDADFFTAHDPDAFKAMKKAPEFYD